MFFKSDFQFDEMSDQLLYIIIDPPLRAAHFFGILKSHDVVSHFVAPHETISKFIVSGTFAALFQLVVSNC